MNTRATTSRRFSELPAYIFAKIETMKAEYEAGGRTVIDLGVGDPDFPTQQNIVEEMKMQLDNPANHRYPSFRGEKALREGISSWYKEQHNVTLDPDSEVMVLIGSKEGIAHLPLAYLDRDDIALVPDPGYPAYYSATILAGGTPYPLPLLRGNRYLPDLAALPPDVVTKSKLLFLNYPNNPTAAVADRAFYTSALEFAAKNSILLCNDFAYSELIYSGEKAVSIMSIPGAIETAVEFHSFSKTFAMAGWRLGFVVGNRDSISALSKIKSCIDSGVFKAVQYAGLKGLLGSTERVEFMRREYVQRRDILGNGLAAMGFDFDKPLATYYFWIKVPVRYRSSMEFAEMLLKEAGVMVTPGIGFGESGEGYFRVSMNASIPTIQEALRRLQKHEVF